MKRDQELPVQQKREADKSQEPTVPMRNFIPNTDIFETEQSLTLVLEMPGVDSENVEVTIEDNVLTVEGRIDFQSMPSCNLCIPNTISGTMPEAFESPARLIRARLVPRLKTV